MEEKNQLTKRTDIVLAIKKLNPGVKISLGDPSLITDNDEYKMFYCSVPGDQLKLPEGLEYNEKNGITNKHNTDGVYNISIRVEEIPQEGDIRFLPEEIEDVSQSTSLLDVTKVIQQLNPYAEIRLGSIKDPIRHRRIYSSVSPEQLILPEGFYYNSKNGITNKHRTESGIYCAFDVSDLRSVDESFLEPKTSEIDVSESTDILVISEAIQRLNPNADIRLANSNFDSRWFERIYSSVPAEKLILPKGFYYNSKNGITNKHNTKSGKYCSIDVEDLRTIDEAFLEPKMSETENQVSRQIPDERIISRNSPTTIEQRKSVMQIIMDTIRNLKDRIFNRGENDGKDR